MSSESPLAASVRQVFRAGEAQLIRTYRGVGVRASDPDARNQLASLSPPLPDIGEALPGTNYTVKDIQINPTGNRSDVSDVSVVYSTATGAGGIATVADQGPTEVSFEVYPETVDIPVVAAVAKPLNTETIELDENGMPADPPVTINTVRPILSKEERSFKVDRARIIYTITGTAAALGIPTGFGFSAVPIALTQQRKIHVIDGVPLLFKMGSIRQTRRSDIVPSGNTFAISYEYLFDAGVAWDAVPSEWVVDPSLGPADDLKVVTDTIGVTEETGDFDVLSAVYLPRIQAPAQIRTLYGAENRYIVPPFCETDLVPKLDHSFPYPSFVPRPSYRDVDAEAWRDLPGVSL